MDNEFWHQKWASNRIGFHLLEANPLLVKHWHALKTTPSESVLVPLCGKSLDMDWLARRQQKVVGIELSEIAVRSFFSEQFITPLVTSIHGAESRYEFDELTIHCGDFFSVSADVCDVAYDRAALIAMPASLRTEYATRLLTLLKPQGRLLLVTLDYPQDQLQGPPFSVSKEELVSLFPECRLTLLAEDIADETHPRRQQGLTYFSENVWLIEKLN